MIISLAIIGKSSCVIRKPQLKIVHTIEVSDRLINASAHQLTVQEVYYEATVYEKLTEITNTRV